MSSKEIEKQYKDLAQRAIHAGLIWQTRFQMISLNSLLIGTILASIMLKLFDAFLAVATFTVIASNAAFFYLEGRRVNRWAMLEREDCLDKAKRIADEE